jgi:hypothetical protein
LSSRRHYGCRIEPCAAIYALDLWSEDSSEKRYEGGPLEVARHANSSKEMQKVWVIRPSNAASRVLPGENHYAGAAAATSMLTRDHGVN